MNKGWNVFLCANIKSFFFTLNEQPVVDDSLDVRIEESCDVMAHLKVWDMDKRASWGSQWLLTQDPHDQLTVLHNNLQNEMNENKIA